MKERLRKWEIELTKEQENQFEIYYQTLEEWNRAMNLTRISGREEVEQLHFIDSLSIAKTNIKLEGKRMIDVGTGAGFPGIPIKIMEKDVSLTLLDAREKKVNFLKEVVEKCQLDKIEILHGRAEDYGQDKKYREKFDLCVARALANLSTICEYCLPFIKVGGCFIAYKSKKGEKELNDYREAIIKMGGEIKEVISFNLPKEEQNRSLLVIKKIKKTPLQYPRKAGVPERAPVK